MTDLVLLSQTTVLLIICDLQTSEYSLHSAFTRSPFWIEAVFYKCSEFPHFLCCITQKWNWVPQLENDKCLRPNDSGNNYNINNNS